MSLPDDFVFSQSALQDYVDCPRRFELRYLREVRWPALETEPALEHESSLLKGQQFHHLLHQHALGVPAETLEATIADDDLRQWWNRYVRWQADHLHDARHPELTLTVPIGEMLLMAKYDVVARMPDASFLIIDWKTGKRPKRPARLAERMQTLVYPYVLSRAGDWLNDGQPIPPERIKMVYWFAETGETIEFQSSEEKLRNDEARLVSLVEEIAARFEYPLTTDEQRCSFCAYRSLCERGERAGDLNELEEDEDELAGELTLDLDQIEEIAF